MVEVSLIKEPSALGGAVKGEHTGAEQKQGRRLCVFRRGFDTTTAKHYTTA